MYQALYRKYRPSNFDEVWGQENVIRVLKNQLQSGSTSHAYIFSGIRGTGKTSIARILAKALNCSGADAPCGKCQSCIDFDSGASFDIFEIDAASNNGVDNIREINEDLKFAPRHGSKRVYIIDEVHMLSTGAFNALLKSLEEPPEHVVFILATTEVQKLPATILSRCLKLDFKRVSLERVVHGIDDISKKEGFSIDVDATKLIAHNGDGSVRDSLTILEQVLNYSDQHITKKDVLSALGKVDEDSLLNFINLFLASDTIGCLKIIDDEILQGKDAISIIRSLILYFRNLLVLKLTESSNREMILNMSDEAILNIESQALKFDLELLNQDIVSLSKVLEMSRWSQEPRLLLDTWVINSLQGRKKAPIQKSVSSSDKQEAKSDSFNLEGYGSAELDKSWDSTLVESGIEEDVLSTIRKFTKLIDISGDFFLVVAKDVKVGKLLKERLDLIEPVLAEMLDEDKFIKIMLKE